MRTLAIELPGIGEPETLRTITRELPDPGPGEAVVRVEATGVSFAEQQMRLGKYYDQPPFPCPATTSSGWSSASEPASRSPRAVASPR
jgi:NADPH:quinone reductase-like Zn-dependent oxidoreductase